MTVHPMFGPDRTSGSRTPTARGRQRAAMSGCHRQLPARTHLLTMDDGVTLAVSEVGIAEAAVTVVFCHGLCLDMESWRHQRSRLSRIWGAEVRMIFYDHRGHGASGDGDPDDNTVERLGRDLAAVLDLRAPGSQVVLVGHSMGGMAVLAYLGSHPHVIGTRVIGVGLIATAADRVAETGLGRALNTPLIDALRLASRGPDWLFQGGWHVGRRLAVPLIGGDTRPVRIRPGTVVSFLSAIRCYDASDTLALLSATPALVLCGTEDPLTPIAHSERLADALPEAEFIVVAGAKHEVTVQHADTVCSAIARLLTRALDTCHPHRLLGADA